jgi:hypothetical protein
MGGNSKVAFDETLFKYAELYTPFDRVVVYNRADEYLCKMKLKNKPISFKMADREALLNNENIVNINPPKLYAGMNVYTLDSTNKRILQSLSYNQVSVVLTNTEDDVSETAEPISLQEYTPGLVYTVSNGLEPIESAIMIKYYAMNYEDVQITKLLYQTIKPFFKSCNRSLFKLDSTGIVQNEYGELTYNGEILNTPINTFSSEDVLLM